MSQIILLGIMVGKELIMADLTIKEVKAKRTEFEGAIIKLIKSFEKETGVKVNYFNIERKNDSDREVSVMKEEDRGAVVNVNAQVEILDMT